MTLPLHSSLPVDRLRELAQRHLQSTVDLAVAVAEIPAPTGAEGDRASFVADELTSRGYHPEIDDVGNVYARRRGKGSGRALMLVAHTDTVFPVGTDVSVKRDGEVLRGAGVGDNSLGVAAMIETLSILDELPADMVQDVIAVASVGEEGLGNLRGVRAAVERYSSDIDAVIAVEGHNLGRVTHAAVGSVRWRVRVSGPGGHSWGAFGKPSAVHGLGRIISDISRIDTPSNPKTTFNVGVIEGGTSVNTIAPHASALVDMRSVDTRSLDDLADRIGRITSAAAGEGLETSVEVLGERPGGSVPRDHPLVQLGGDILSDLGFEPVFDASSTDANIPISRGIPAICIGISRGGLGHTVNEFIEIPPIELGLRQLVSLVLASEAVIAAGVDERA